MNIEALEMPQGAEREYLTLFGVAAIYIATGPGGEACIVGVSCDLARTHYAIRRKRSRMDIVAAFWVKDRATADGIAVEVITSLPHNPEGLLAERAEVACWQIARVAAHRHVPLTSHDATMTRVRAAVQRVQERIAEAQAAGDLAWFNSAYRSWRLVARQSGQGMSYAEARARLRRVVTKRFITLDNFDLDHALLPSIFPALPGRSENLR
jgi:hypothetical protein